jgi:nuclear transport factor 2 (NTF2) superfamily protein
VPATTELYCAQVQVALAQWSHFGWYSAVGFWFRKRGTDVLALSQAGKMRKLEAIKNRFPVQNSFSISIISHRQRLAHANDSAIIPRDFVFGVDP